TAGGVYPGHERTGLTYGDLGSLLAQLDQSGLEARERLARRLFLDAHLGDRYAQQQWDFGGDQHVNREPWLARATKYLAVIAGKES
ncbi:MAG TPA: hypothetical protein VFT95_00960, partial [Micromonosporaceae bacterium]|nr:hypothetical protein [Micromonosporaceae bacterium]